MEQPTDEQTKAVIAKFEDLAPRINQNDAFGGSNRANIDIQIRVLKEYNNFMDMEEMAEEFEVDPDSDYDLYSHFRDAWDWCDGEFDEADGKFEDGWDSMVGRPEPEQLRREDYE